MIVSNDYGELGSAMYFLEGLPQGTRTMLLLPAGLIHALPDSPELPVRGYTCFADLRRHLDAQSPEAVMLFSGYLLTVGRRFSVVNVVRLLRLLRSRAVAVFTTNPFLGLAARPGDLDFRAVLGRTTPPWLRWLRAKHLAIRVVLLGRLLKGYWHIYASPLPPNASGSGPRRALSYCSAPAGPRPPDRPGERPRWLFVLSEVDCQIQTERNPDFPRILAARMRETADLGRQPVLVAPALLVAAVRSQLGNVKATFATQATYREFEQHVASAEYAFYWNFFSFSLMHRVLAGLPVLWFAEGHMMSILPALRDAGLRLFYGSWIPPLIDLFQPFTLEGLDTAAGESRAQFALVARSLRDCGSPAKLLMAAMTSAQDGDVPDPVA